MKAVVSLFATLLVATCGGNSGGTMDTYETSSVALENAIPMNQMERNESNPVTSTEERKVIWSGSAEIKVANVDQTTTKINELCQKYGAFVSGMQMNNTTYEISNQIVIRVGSDRFNQLLEDIKKEAEFINNVTVSSNDVTEEFIDVQSRLKTKKEVRERYVAILQNNTGKIAEVLEAEEAIRKITEEIEAKEGRLRYLENQVRYSTLNVRLYETVSFSDEPLAYKKSFGSKVVQSFKGGWQIVTTLILAVITIWPLLLILGLIFWRWKWVKAKAKNKQ